jgi:hypothetical protein
VINWTEHGLQFPGLKPRKRTDAVCIHWSGAENGAGRMYENLRDKGLSVHFFISDKGEVWQYNDCDAFGAHAKGMNDRTVGVEVQNRANNIADDGHVKRALVRENIHGKDFVYTMFTPDQVRAVLAVSVAICEAYGLPWQVPMEPKPVTQEFMRDALMTDGSRMPVRRVIPRQLTDEEFKAFRGVLCHFHRTPVGKRDAGIAILEAVAAFEKRSEQGIGGPAQ